MKPNYRIIAERAGVSLTTVSLALRNSPKISEATRKKVAQVAAELGYERNPLVDALMSRISSGREPEYQGTIAALCYAHGDPENPHLSFHPRFRAGAEERAARAGYKLELYALPDPADAKAWNRLRRTLVARGVRGILIAPLGGAWELPETFFDGFATAAIGFAVRRPELHHAASRHFVSTRQALAQMGACGYERVGLVSLSGIHEGVNHQVTASYIAWQHDRGRAILPPLLLDSFTEPEDLRIFHAWVRENWFDAILIGHSTGRLLASLERLQIAVPADLGVACLFRSPEETVAGIDIHAERIGANAIDLVVGQMLRNEYGLPEAPKVVLTTGEWLEGQTLRGVPRPSFPGADGDQGSEPRLVRDS